MPLLDIDAALAERARERGSDDLAFVLGGATFSCAPIIPFGVWAEFYKAPGVGDDPVGYVDGVVAFLGALADTDPDKVRAAVEASGIDLGGIVDLVGQLSAVYNGRPTSPSTESPDGPEDGTASTDGEPSKPKRSSKGSARSSTSTGASPSAG